MVSVKNIVINCYLSEMNTRFFIGQQSVKEFEIHEIKALVQW